MHSHYYDQHYKNHEESNKIDMELANDIREKIEMLIDDGMSWVDVQFLQQLGYFNEI